MIKIMLATVATIALAGAAGAQMSGGNSTSMQSGSTSGSTGMKGKTHTKHMTAHKKTMSKKGMSDMNSGAGTSNGDSAMGNHM